VIELGLLYLACFISMALVDVTLIRHQQAVAAGRALAAGAWSVACYGLGFVDLAVASRVSLWCVVPGALGLLVGNLWAIQRGTLPA
jgi:hypothetical protein